jgi:hypothetical protein
MSSTASYGSSVRLRGTEKEEDGGDNATHRGCSEGGGRRSTWRQRVAARADVSVDEDEDEPQHARLRRPVLCTRTERTAR